MISVGKSGKGWVDLYNFSCIFCRKGKVNERKTELSRYSKKNIATKSIL